LFLGNIPKAVSCGKILKDSSRRWKNFKCFFEQEQHFFIPKYLGQSDDEKFICFNTIFNKLGLHQILDYSIFIKMDIEIWEYRVIPDLLPFLIRLMA
jgi:hypothetical protein